MCSSQSRKSENSECLCVAEQDRIGMRRTREHEKIEGTPKQLKLTIHMKFIFSNKSSDNDNFHALHSVTSGKNEGLALHLSTQETFRIGMS